MINSTNLRSIVVLMILSSMPKTQMKGNKLREKRKDKISKFSLSRKMYQKINMFTGLRAKIKCLSKVPWREK